ncbi:MAG: Holliday junction branch migration DNA helicase RuvB [Vampirovibrionales bacterium]|nr:Holliday junction branch migration DNA helicase RuvB [Vampirovibrionales bacterium]
MAIQLDSDDLGKIATSSSGARRSGMMDAFEKPAENRFDAALRPKTLESYEGQAALKAKLSVALSAAKVRQEAIEHVLLYGPPGLGKTTLASILASELGVGCVMTSAPVLEKPRDIVGILMGMEPKAVLFIDEIHRLNRVTEEILYTAMEDFTLDRAVGSGEATRTLRIPLPKFTLVGATTRAGELTSPLRDRFGLHFRLEFYTPAELAHILTRSARLLDLALSPEAAHLIATRSRGTPRIANRLLKRVRDYAQVSAGALSVTLCATLTQEALNLYDIDAHGLDATDRKILTLLAHTFAGRPVGIETLASTLGEDVNTLEDVYEPYLVQQGFVLRTPRGRQISPSALMMLNGWQL